MRALIRDALLAIPAYGSGRFHGVLVRRVDLSRYSVRGGAPVSLDTAVENVRTRVRMQEPTP